MWSKINLRFRIYTVVLILVFITIFGGLVMVWYTYKMEGLITHIVDRNITGLEAAEELVNALATQKGFVSYYFIDGNPAWLEMLKEHRRIFREQIAKIQSVAAAKEQKALIFKIGEKYAQYNKLKDQVIRYYRAGEMEKGKMIHEKIRPLFSDILDLCDKYREISRETIKELRHKSSVEAVKLRSVAATAVLIVLILSVLLVFILVHDILEPVRRLAQETVRDNANKHKSKDDVKVLEKSVHGLLEKYAHTSSELEKSKEYLFQAEKLALVGKLAAGTSHSIRNPLTSVKMRLFSLGRSLELNDAQKEDFDVISEEISHIDNILQNFLEFSRPPRLKLQMISPSAVVDQVVLLLRHRLESCNGRLVVERTKQLPEMQIDPEQLKESIANIVVNACEAMGAESGGFITIKEEEKIIKGAVQAAFIRISDNGPGIPKRIQQKIFEPFFTTKEEGSGLGLSIVARIIEEHGGHVSVESEEGKGTSFIIVLPITPQKETIN